jgi:hypothetical protein
LGNGRAIAPFNQFRVAQGLADAITGVVRPQAERGAMNLINQRMALD